MWEWMRLFHDHMRFHIPNSHSSTKMCPALPRLYLGSASAANIRFFIDFRRFWVWKHIWSWKSRVHSHVLAPFGARTREWTRLFHNNDDVHSPNSTRILKRGSFAGGIPIQKPGFCPRRVLASFGDFWRAYLMSGTPAQTPPSRAHPKDDARSKQLPQIEFCIVWKVLKGRINV